jgi:SlyX protein
MSDPTEKLHALEIKFAFHEHTLDTLNQVIAQQDHELIRLKRRLDELEATVKRTDPNRPDADAVERPPHY